MKQGTIKYSQEFISPTGLKRWIGIEYPVDFDSEDFLAVYNKVKAMVLDCGDSTPPYSELPTRNAPVSDSLPTINRAAERLAMLIENAKDLQELHGYWEKASEHGLFKEYNEKENFLIAKEVENEH